MREVLVQMSDMEACSLGNGGAGGEAPGGLLYQARETGACVWQVTIAGRGLRDFAKATDAGRLDIRLLNESSRLLHIGSRPLPRTLHTWACWTGGEEMSWDFLVLLGLGCFSWCQVCPS